MDKIEELYQEAFENNAEIIDYQFNSKNIKGLYCDGTIALSKDLKSRSSKQCILAEEIGHHITSSGEIIDMSITENRKQEMHARVWSYNRLVGLNGIISCHKAHCFSKYEMAEYLDVTEEFLTEAINHYHSKYGIYAKLDNYVIYFEPVLCVLEINGY